MNTCVSMKCPFISVCKEYNFLIDRGQGCVTQNKILRAAKELESKDASKVEAKGKMKGIK